MQKNQKRVLVLMFEDQRVIFDRLYDGMREAADCDIRSLVKSEQKNLKSYFKEKVKLEDYDRVLFFLRFKYLLKQVSFLQSLTNLVFLEPDACQNYIKSKYYGKFSFVYRQIPWCRVLSSGSIITNRLKSEGIDTVFVPKGYDQMILRNLDHKRDIELGFLGSIGNSVYSQRKTLLESLVAEENLFITRTASGLEYLETLNRIKFFISADVGLDEYMAKNFEAMACGCIVFAYDQGEQENNALGFVDMENIVLYKGIQDIQEKLQILRSNNELTLQIAQNGQKFAEDHYAFNLIGQRVIHETLKPLRAWRHLSFFEKIKLRFRG